MPKDVVGFLLMFVGVFMVASGFSIPYGLTGALISGGLMVAIYGLIIFREGL